jgi:MATE family multidrug resistance protein
LAITNHQFNRQSPIFHHQLKDLSNTICLMLRELRSLLTIAWPVVLAEMGWLLMGLVDTIMVGPLGPAAIGAVGAGTILFMVPMMVGYGMLLALDTFVSQSYGAGRIDECHRWLFAALQLAAVLSVVLSLLAWGGVALLPLLQFHPDVLVEIRPYMTHLVWSTAPLLFYVVFRRYLQAMGVVRPIMIAIVIANLVNLAANWLLVEGRLGFPRLGVVGAAQATVFSRLALAVYLGGLIVVRERRRPSGLHDVPFTFDLPRMARIVRLGSPAAGQILLEVGVFAAASALAGRIAPMAVAAHQIVLNIVGFIFMIPFGISSAAAVRVGHAVGRGDQPGARLAGWVAVGLTTSVMAFSALLLATVPAPLIRVFTGDSMVIETGVRLMLVAAVFQLFDGLQVTTTGALRGLGNTHVPMFVNLAGHWLIGLPVAWLLCFNRAWGVEGLWVGLALGLTLIGATLLYVWHHQSRVFHFRRV